MVRTCPVCRLLSPPEAWRCDCGFDFVAQTRGGAESPVKGNWECLVFLAGTFGGALGGGGLAATDDGGPHGYGLFLLVPFGMLIGASLCGPLGYLTVKIIDAIYRLNNEKALFTVSHGRFENHIRNTIQSIY